jgi:hypothetical protein
LFSVAGRQEGGESTTPPVFPPIPVALRRGPRSPVVHPKAT